MSAGPREGSLGAPTRHPIDWQSESFYDEKALHAELERVFDVCHGCRRCFSLCNSFPTLFDAIDASATGELDAVPKEVYWDVVDHCYLCDMCFMSKCPYVPPHEWNIDFPHLMLRAKAKRFRDEGASWRDSVLASTDKVGALAGIPVIAEVVNAVNRSAIGRLALEKGLGVDRTAPVPEYHANTARRQLAARVGKPAVAPAPDAAKVVLYTTCYGNRNVPQVVADMVAVFAHNSIDIRIVDAEECCGMPRLELGDLEVVAAAGRANVKALLPWAQDGWTIVAPVPSCVLMFRQELPLLLPEDVDVAAVAAAFRDPFEYLYGRHRAGLLRTEFRNSLGKIAYQVPCHLRVQNIGLKTRDVLQLVPGTEIEVIERCSGHDGTYGVKKKFRQQSLKIAAPVMRKVEQAGAAHLTSDCPMAGAQVAGGLEGDDMYRHPFALLRRAYGV